MKNALRIAALALLVGGMVPACSCEDPGTATRALDPVPSKLLVDFGVVCIDSVAPQSFTIENEGLGGGEIELVLVGEEQAVSMFSVTPTKATLAGIGATQDVTVTYHPDPANGAAESQRHAVVLELRYTSEGVAMVKRVELEGDVSPNAAIPVVSYACGEDVIECEHREGESVACCNPESSGRGISSILLPHLYRGSEYEVPLVVSNAGCGPLEVSSITIVPNEEVTDCDAPDAVTVDKTSFTVAGGAESPKSELLNLKWKPGYANPEQTGACNFSGTLTFTTSATDEYGTHAVSVNGAAKDPSIVTIPQSVNFGEYVHPETTTKEVTIYNTGNSEIELDLTASPNDFVVQKAETLNCEGGTVVGRIPVSLEDGRRATIAANDVANCGPDQMVVTLLFQPQDEEFDQGTFDVGWTDPATSESGNVVVQLRGGAYPKLVVAPDPINFTDPTNLNCDSYSCVTTGCLGSCKINDDCPTGETCDGGWCTSADTCAPTCGAASRTVTISNVGKAPLDIERIAIEDVNDPSHEPLDGTYGYPILHKGDDLCTGKKLAQGQSCDVTVEFKDTNTGGFTLGYLRIESNDADFAGFINIFSRTSQDRGTEGGNLNFEPLDVTAMNWVTVDMSHIVDYGPDGVTEQPFTWEWQVKPPNDASWIFADEPGDWVSIDPANLGKNCSRTSLPCFECLSGGKGACSALRFFADISGDWEVRIRTEDQGCDHPHEGEHGATIDVRP